jgi:hypothetical protein
MHYNQIPQDILVKDRTTGKTEKLSFLRYAELIWLNDARWETPKTNLARLVRVVAEFEKAPGDWFSLEDQDWAIVKGIIDSPAAGANGPNLLVPLVQIQVGPTFEGAILDAPTKDPREVIAPNGAAPLTEAKKALEESEKTLSS